VRHATLKQLRIFEAAARHLHFGRAAEELHLSQPAVSIQLKLLEEDVGFPLFEQMGRRMYLTHAGEEFAGHVRAVLARLREAAEAMDSLKSDGAGEIHIACTTTAEYFVPRLLAEFRRQRPRLKIRLTVKNRELVIRDLTDNAVDLVVMGQPPRDLDATAVQFAKNPLALIASPEHPHSKKRQVLLSQLEHESFLIRERGSGTRDAMERMFSAQHFRPSEMVEIGTNETIKQAVMAGMGVSFLSLHTIGFELASKRLAVLRVAGTPVMRDWYVMHRSRKRLSQVATAFKDYLIAKGAALIDQAVGQPVRRRNAS
jgi:DNA-binding transcriptional LysR family regulator